MPVWVKGMLLLAVALTAGVAIGGAYERHRLLAHETVGMEPHHAMHRLQQELGLDSAQQKAIAVILARHQGAVDSTWHALHPLVRATLDSTLREVVGILRPDQLARYWRMVEEH